MEIEISISRAFPNRNLETRNDEKKMINNQPNILLKLKGLKNGFNMAEKRLTEYILKNTDKVILQKIRDLEYESGVSYATIIRFTKKLGFSGFKEFKNSLIKTSSPSKEKTPSVGGISRMSVRPTVVLPQPLSPTSPSVLPASIVNVTPSTAFTCPMVRLNRPALMGKCVFRFRTSTNFFCVWLIRKFICFNYACSSKACFCPAYQQAA